MLALLGVILAYLIGGIPFGYLLVRLKTGGDVRSAGSGNIGATNVYRTSGKAIGVATLLLDILKGWVAVFLTGRLSHGDTFWMSAAAVAVLLGHIFPVFLRFQGGKAVASYVGAFLYLTPVALAAVVVVFVAAVWRTSYISLGSIVGAICFPLAVWIVVRPEWPVVLAAVLCSGLVIWRHKTNIARLRQGTENRFSLGRSRV